MADTAGGNDAGAAYVVFGVNRQPTSQPSSQPSRQPSAQPTRQPTCQPSTQPSTQPTGHPSRFSFDVDLKTMTATQGFRITGSITQDRNGYAVSGGDVTGDGISDAIVTAQRAEVSSGVLNTGIVYVIFGRNTAAGASPFSDIILTTGSTPLPVSVGFRIIGAILNDEVGTAVSAVGDINDDGINDILIGAPSADPPSLANAGITYVIFGAAAGSTGLTYVIYGRKGLPVTFSDFSLPNAALPWFLGFRILGFTSNDNSGYSVSSAGDLNEDGIDDLIMGAYSAVAGTINAGVAYVIFGRNLAASGAVLFGDIQLTNGPTALSSGIGFRIIGVATGNCFGNSVRLLGDVNNDGVDDVIIGANFANPSSIANAGIAYVVFGRSQAVQDANPFVDIPLTPSAMPATVGFRILAAVSGDQVGYAVDSAGDVNDDGIVDILVGAPIADPPNRSGAGIAYIIFGRNIAGGGAAFGDIQLTSGAVTMPTAV